MKKRRSPLRQVFWLLLVVVLALGVYGARHAIRNTLFNLTGEESVFSQLKGLTDLTADMLRPRLDLAPDAPVKYANVNPYGVNVFLNEEVEPAKREETVRLAKEAGYHWLRQEFPWQDIEIHGKGDFTDKRNGPAKSSWEKYDQIVDLAEKYDMELIVRLSTPPSWTRAKGDEVGTFAPPDNYDDFGDFVYQVVNRYKGRVKFYQLWNEPNIYPEWGSYSISPEDYTRLLKAGATRAREADPNAVIIAGALASTIELAPDAPPPGNALNDLIYLQRMYDAGAAPYFDIMAMQGYGLWSGPTDRRMNPRVMNFGRPQYVRDLMVKNGDANKPIWISEMGWNSVPADAPDQRFGRVTPEQQGRYTNLAYDRVEAEWPWAGVVNTWYLKRATDEWLKAKKPEAYFRLADPDFKLQPVYEAVKEHLNGNQGVLSPGMHEPQGWGITEQGTWATATAPDAPYGTVRTGQAGSTLWFDFIGTTLSLQTACPGGAACNGDLRVTIDGTSTVTVTNGSELSWTSPELTGRKHAAKIEVLDGAAGLTSLTVRDELPFWLRWIVPATVVVLIVYFFIRQFVRVIRARRKPKEPPSLPPPPLSDEPPAYPQRRLWRGAPDESAAEVDAPGGGVQ